MNSTISPFFIVGCQRSGTTVLRLILNQHSKVAIPFETAFVTEIYHKLDQFGDFSNYEIRKNILDEIANNRFVQRAEL